MKRIILAFFLVFIFNLSFAQVRPNIDKKEILRERNVQLGDSARGTSRNTSNKNIKNKDAKIEDYLIISHQNDTTFVDTTLTIQKEYKYNYLRKDNFNLMPFSNIGQSYNTLSHDLDEHNLMPSFGARARHFNYMEIDDIYYYHVPTPLTELFYKTAFEQGQVLDAFFTVNTSKQFNISMAYKGLRSLGKYQHILTSTGNFRVTTNYSAKDKRYLAKAHFVSQDLLNEENAGLRDDNVPFFENGDPEFLDRAILDVNFQNAESILKGKRFYLDHKYYLINQNDSISKNKLSLGHVMTFDDKYYQFDQTAANDYFGDSFKSSNLRDGVSLEDFHNQLQLNYTNNIIGDVQFNVGHNNYNYGYDRLVVINASPITNRLKGDIVSVGAKYKKQIGGFKLNGALGLNVSGDLEGNYINGEASYNINDDLSFQAMIQHNSTAPNYNYLLYQSNYTNYNWKNNFNNIEKQQLAFSLNSNKIANVSVDFTTISDYTYFKRDENSVSVKAFQSDKPINYLRLKLNKEIRFKKFALDNTVMYQKVKDDNRVFNVPEIITRNTLYYATHLFKKALYMQTGVTFNYFTEYYMNAYDPLLSEFYVQTDKKYGSFPRLDIFLNAKIRQTRIYLKAEHVNSAWTGYNYYAAPNNPYRDFTIRFGLVWNFFL